LFTNFVINRENIGELNLITAKSPRGISFTAATPTTTPRPMDKAHTRDSKYLPFGSNFLGPFCTEDDAIIE
jgi:hypothetical protein